MLHLSTYLSIRHLCMTQYRCLGNRPAFPGSDIKDVMVIARRPYPGQVFIIISHTRNF